LIHIFVGIIYLAVVHGIWGCLLALDSESSWSNQIQIGGDAQRVPQGVNVLLG
jgi:hypothetical protein